MLDLWLLRTTASDTTAYDPPPNTTASSYDLRCLCQ
jgi:hypothetical protein